MKSFNLTLEDTQVRNREGKTKVKPAITGSPGK